MALYMSKRSSVKDKADNSVVYEALDRGHQSEVSQMKKSQKIPLSTRRIFTFVGSAGKITVNPPSSAKSRTPTKPPTPKTRTPRSHTDRRSRSRSTLRSKLLSSMQQSTTVKKDRSRSSSAGSHRDTSHQPQGSVKNHPSSVKNQQPSKPVTPIPVEIAPPVKEAVSPAILLDEDLKIDTKETKEELVAPAVVVPSASSSDEDAKDDDDDASSSPSVIGYRKLAYDESQDKWIEYWKLEEDVKRIKKKERIQKLMERWEARKEKPHVHPIKGRITAKMQVMFPTAIVKQERRHGQYYRNIQMTDPLRVELYKRRAPIVPTYYQEHIVKFGKLPFRNNPRPHPIV